MWNKNYKDQILEAYHSTFNIFIDRIGNLNKIVDKQSQAISKLAEYIDRVNANSNAPYSSDLEEEIKKTLWKKHQ